MKKLVLSVVSFVVLSSSVFAGPYSGDTVGTAWNSPDVLEWADQVVSANIGPVDIQDPSGAKATVGDVSMPATMTTPAYVAYSNALGQSDALQNSGNVDSLGDGGSIVLSFATPIANGPGADLSVFENGFQLSPGQDFLELGFVSVSSDGINFFTFPSVSLTQTTTQVGGFGTLDPTNIYDLAGKTVAGIGTDFDLSELVGVSPLLNVNDVKYVKVTDVVGDINPTYATKDSLGNIINDPYPTAFPSGGFDLDAIAVLNEVPEPSTWALLPFGLGLLFLRVRRYRVRAAFVLSVVALMTGFAHADTAIDFSSLSPNLPSASSGGGAVNDTPFSVDGIGFNNSYDSTYGSWASFAYSNTNETSTPGADFNYQYSAAGTGISTFAVGYIDNFDPNPTITLPAGEQPTSLTITNDVYAELSMENGDSFAKKFAGPQGDTPGDYFLLTITGYNSITDTSTGSVPFYLANFLSATPADDYIVDSWTNVSLSGLGAGTDELVFTETSSDTGEFGVNTPEYFALGGLSITEAPEPSSWLLLAAGLAILFHFKRRRV